MCGGGIEKAQTYLSREGGEGLLTRTLEHGKYNAPYQLSCLICNIEPLYTSHTSPCI